MTGEFTWGFDGWIYACHGFQNTSTVKAKDGSTISDAVGQRHRFAGRFRVEQMTHGRSIRSTRVRPARQPLFCVCHCGRSINAARAWYPSFGKPHDGLGFGPEMMRHDHGSTAIAGIAYYAADHFRQPIAHTFRGNVVTNRINHDRLEWQGSTPKAVQLPDFMTSEDPWFRPVDIKLGPDARFTSPISTTGSSGTTKSTHASWP